ncbi:MAG: sulfurtransferase complex subunit TusB [Candidatus Hodarchaeota archaeon]
MSVKKSIVYLFGFSITSSDKIKSLLKILKLQVKTDTEISIVLIHDGVIGISKRGKTPKLLLELLNLPLNTYAMIPDIKARGIDPNHLINQIKGIEYDELVDILAEKEHIVSWM